MIAIMACLGYWALLTVLLLLPHPETLLGRTPRLPWGDFGVHFTALATLSFLVHAMRWPRHPAFWTVALLVVYGLATETLQSLMPPRTVELKDYVENVLGALVGAAIYWGIQRRFARRSRPHLAKELARQEVARAVPTE